MPKARYRTSAVACPMGLARWRSGETPGNLIIKQKTWGFMRIYHQTHGDLTSCKDMGILVVNTATLIPLVMKHAMATESLPFKQVMQFTVEMSDFPLPCSMSCREYLSWYLAP